MRKMQLVTFYFSPPPPPPLHLISRNILGLLVLSTEEETLENRLGALPYRFEQEWSRESYWLGVNMVTYEVHLNTIYLII